MADDGGGRCPRKTVAAQRMLKFEIANENKQLGCSRERSGMVGLEGSQRDVEVRAWRS